MPASLSPTAYAHSYGLVPIANSQGRIRRARSPDAAQWWCPATEWTRLRRAIRGGADPDVLGTAQRLGVAIATHDVVMARSAAAATLLDQALQ